MEWKKWKRNVIIYRRQCISGVEYSGNGSIIKGYGSNMVRLVIGYYYIISYQQSDAEIFRCQTMARLPWRRTDLKVQCYFKTKYNVSYNVVTKLKKKITQDSFIIICRNILILCAFKNETCTQLDISRDSIQLIDSIYWYIWYNYYNWLYESD